jgi:2-polyprenyl-3-methyl-5-hydroxy-6-metoxy-1,4-benzoquinol methylase
VRIRNIMSETVVLGPHPDFPFCQVVHDGDFCYTDPYPSNDQLAEYYSSTYRAVRQEAPTVEYVAFMEARAKAQANFIRETCSCKSFSSILDIGSGCGALLAELSNNADSLEGWEPDASMCDYALQQHSSEHTRFINDLFIPGRSDQQFDLITMSHVLEHVPHPRVFLEQLRTMHLSKPGWLFIEVPNDPAWWVTIQIANAFEGLAHVNFFTPSSLSRTLMNSALEPLLTRTAGITVSEFCAKRTKRSSRVHRLLQRWFQRPAVRRDTYRPSADDTAIYIQAIAQSV